MILLNSENIKLLQRQKEITRLQTELVTEKKMIDAKLDLNIVQKFKLEKRKLEILPKLQAPLPCVSHIPQLNVPLTPPSTHPTHLPITPPQKSPCAIRPVAKRYIFPLNRSDQSKVRKQLVKSDEWSACQISDDDLLKELNKLDK